MTLFSVYIKTNIYTSPDNLCFYESERDVTYEEPVCGDGKYLQKDHKSLSLIILHKNVIIFWILFLC